MVRSIIVNWRVCSKSSSTSCSRCSSRVEMGLLGSMVGMFCSKGLHGG